MVTSVVASQSQSRAKVSAQAAVAARALRRAAATSGGAALPHAERALQVVIVDGNPILRRGLRSVVEERLHARVVAEACSGAEALLAVKLARPAVVALDVRKPPCDRLAVLPRLSRLCRVVVLSHSSDPHLVRHVLSSGGVAFLVHGEYSADDVTRALAEARRSSVHLSAPSAQASARTTDSRHPRLLPVPARPAREQLSRREAEVMDHIADGLSNSDVACILGLTEKTVKNHINRIFAKLDVTTRARAIVLWLNGDVGSVQGPREPTPICACFTSEVSVTKTVRGRVEHDRVRGQRWDMSSQPA